MARKKREVSPEHPQVPVKLSLGDVVQEKKRQQKIPVFIGDSNNTVIFINADRDPEDAKKRFLSRLDQYNPARSESSFPAEPAPQPEHLKQYQAANAKSSQQNESDAGEFSPFKF